MSFPSIPNITPQISLGINEVVNLLLASIALEELGLAHIVNAEAEKIQFVLGTLPGQTSAVPPTLSNILDIDKSVLQTLKAVIKKEMLLEFKLEDILGIPTQQINVHEDTATVTATFDGATITARDSAYYYTIS